LHLIQSFLAKHSIPQVHQAAYFSDMAPCDFWLFLGLKTPLKGSRFDSHEDIIPNLMAQLHSKTSLPEVLPVMEGPLG
jgi:hypothetical protein